MTSSQPQIQVWYVTVLCGKLKSLVKKLIGKVNYNSNEHISLLATTNVLQLIIVNKMIG
jgi:hypothetical protein